MRHEIFTVKYYAAKPRHSSTLTHICLDSSEQPQLHGSPIQPLHWSLLFLKCNDSWPVFPVLYSTACAIAHQPFFLKALCF